MLYQTVTVTVTVMLYHIITVILDGYCYTRWLLLFGSSAGASASASGDGSGSGSGSGSYVYTPPPINVYSV